MPTLRRVFERTQHRRQGSAPALACDRTALRRRGSRRGFSGRLRRLARATGREEDHAFGRRCGLVLRPGLVLPPRTGVSSLSDVFFLPLRGARRLRLRGLVAGAPRGTDRSGMAVAAEAMAGRARDVAPGPRVLQGIAAAGVLAA